MTQDIDIVTTYTDVNCTVVVPDVTSCCRYQVDLLGTVLGALAPRGVLNVVSDNLEYARVVADCAAEASHHASTVRIRNLFEGCSGFGPPWKNPKI